MILVLVLVGVVVVVVFVVNDLDLNTLLDQEMIVKILIYVRILILNWMIRFIFK